MPNAFKPRVVGNFTVLSISHYNNTQPIYNVRCKCGRESKKQGGNVFRQTGCGPECPITQHQKALGYQAQREAATKVSFRGKKVTQEAAAIQIGLKKTTVLYRVRKGISLDRPFRSKQIYRNGLTAKDWSQILQIKLAAFYMRAQKYGPNDDRVYLPRSASR